MQSESLRIPVAHLAGHGTSVSKAEGVCVHVWPRLFSYMSFPFAPTPNFLSTLFTAVKIVFKIVEKSFNSFPHKDYSFGPPLYL